ncbi:hypothetical protein D0466_00055 [Peribacillus glennii]|uniref:Uncharacterized protein n=1 Tax=Peribacillus glennii TaxID=2303991 RepID=A0A372LK29_9BACI|nr:hypothetical protein D0466_00055 [Peribacillus glennii]
MGIRHVICLLWGYEGIPVSGRKSPSSGNNLVLGIHGIQLWAFFVTLVYGQLAYIVKKRVNRTCNLFKQKEEMP